MRGTWMFRDGCNQAILFDNLAIGVRDGDLTPYNEETVVVRGILHTNYVPEVSPQAGFTGPHDVYFLTIDEIVPKGNDSRR